MMRRILLFITVVLLTTACKAQSQSAASDYLFDSFNERHFTVVSESLIRAVINFADTVGDLKSLGKDLEKVVYFSIESEGFTDSHSKSLDKLIGEEGFELLMSLDQSAASFALYVLEDEDVTQSVMAVGNANGKFHFVEIVGNLDPAYFLKLFSGMQQGNGKDQVLDLANLLNIDF